MPSSEVSSPNASVDGDAPGPGATTPGRGVPGGGPRGWARAVRRRLTPEHLVVLVLALLVLVVHDLGYILNQPYWTDEDWVALTTKFPLSQLPATTNSTPIGWSVLLRFFSVNGTQTGRLMPLAFAAAAVLAAYWFARRLDWPSREISVGAGLLAGIAMLLVPAMLIRDDLKQYTADAFFAVVALALTSRLERVWLTPGVVGGDKSELTPGAVGGKFDSARRGLVALSVVTWAGMLISDTVAFVGAAVFGAVCLVQLVRRDWRRLAESAVVGAVTAVLMLAVYKVFDARAVTPSLTYSPHFANYYPPLHKGKRAFLRFVYSHFQREYTHFGLGPLWLVALLFAVGLVVIFWRGRPVTAIALAALWPEMIVISAARLYPFIDARTSTFLFAVTAVVAAIGVAGVCALLRPWLKGSLAVGLAVLAVAGFVVCARPFIRSHEIPNEDMKALTLYIADHASPNDVIVLAQDSNFGFAYYWPTGQPSREADNTIIQEYEAYFPSQPRIVVALSRTPAGVDAAMAQALDQSRLHGCSSMWLVRTHITGPEEAAYDGWLSQRHLSAVSDGPSGLTYIQMNKSVCQ